MLKKILPPDATKPFGSRKGWQMGLNGSFATPNGGRKKGVLNATERKKMK